MLRLYAANEKLSTSACPAGNVSVRSARMWIWRSFRSTKDRLLRWYAQRGLLFARRTYRKLNSLEVRILEKQRSGFGLGDFYIDYYCALASWRDFQLHVKIEVLKLLSRGMWDFGIILHSCTNKFHLLWSVSNLQLGKAWWTQICVPGRPKSPLFIWI